MSAVPRFNSDRTDFTEAAFLALVKSIGLLSRVMNPYFTAHGITGAQWGVLRVLQRAEDEGLVGLRQTDLGERLIVRPPSITAVIGRLLRLGLIARGVFEDDQRAKIVSLTNSGRRLLQTVIASHGKQLDAVLGGLALPERRDLHRLLNRMNDHLDHLAEAAEHPTPALMRRTSRPRATQNRISNRKTRA